jgi:hypothetical protein
MKRLIMITCLLALFFTSGSWAQVPPRFPLPVPSPTLPPTPPEPEIAPPINPEPFAKPKPFMVIQTGNARQLLKAISDSTKRFGFTITHDDPTEFQLEAVKACEFPVREDRVLVWLERDIQKPREYIRVYFLFGSFMRILGDNEGFSRVEVSAEAEVQRVGALKKSLLSLQTNR